MIKFLRIFGIVSVVAIVFAAIVVSITFKPSRAEQIWDEQTTIGNLNAKNYFIVYSDLACPYCVAFENAIVENEEEFREYLAKNDILFEVRLSDFLYEYSGSQAISSRQSAIATYCAKNQGKFWDYYNKAVTSVWNNYFKTNGKAGFTALNAAGKEYWINIGKQIGLSENFENCVINEEPLPEIMQNAKKTRELVSGMPSFKFNRYSPPGFYLNGTWEHVKSYFAEGLKS